MATMIKVTVLETPSKKDLGSPSRVQGIATSNIQEVYAATNPGLSGKNTVIYARVNQDNAIITGNYLVNESYTDVIDDINTADS